MTITACTDNEYGNMIVGQVNEFFVIFNEKKKEYYAVPRSQIDGPLKNAVVWKTYKKAYRSAEVQDLRFKGYSWEEIDEWKKKREAIFSSALSLYSKEM